MSRISSKYVSVSKSKVSAHSMEKEKENIDSVCKSFKIFIRNVYDDDEMLNFVYWHSILLTKKDFFF